MSDSVAVHPPIPQEPPNYPNLNDVYEENHSSSPSTLPPPPPSEPPTSVSEDTENPSISLPPLALSRCTNYAITPSIMNGNWSENQLQVVDTDRPTSEVCWSNICLYFTNRMEQSWWSLQLDASIEELLNTLECPICLDTADHPPIYQCPEGHLLCESCNSHLKDCPQCGHALMNSRNRTAEELAEKLQTLKARGSAQADLPPGTFSSQNLKITVSEPQKSRKGIMLVISYTIKTVVQQERKTASGPPEENQGIKDYLVSRTYSDVKALYSCMVREYQNEGVIVPFPPDLGSNAVTTASTVAVASMTRNDNLTTSVVTDKRCLALARYLNRIARHPVLRKDPTYRAFLQETDVPKGLKAPSKSAKERWNLLKERILIFRSVHKTFTNHIRLNLRFSVNHFSDQNFK